MGVTNTLSNANAISLEEFLERIYLRFAMIESDEQLQNFTDNNLIRLIETTSSNPEAIEKIREILCHYNRRIKTSTVITFPVKDLISIVKSKGSFAAHLSFVYLRFATTNFGEEEHLELLPSLLDVLSLKFAEPSHYEELLGLSVPAFMIIAQKKNHTWPALSFSANVELLLLRFFHCIVVFGIDPPDIVVGNCAALKRGEKLSTPVLTSEEYIVIAEKVFSRVESIVQVKVNTVKLLVSGLFDDAAIFSILVLASAQNFNEVTSAAESALKKIDIQACVDNRVVIDELMAAYLGHTAPTKPIIGKTSLVSPANGLMKQKILMYLMRSPVASVAYMNNVKVCLDGLNQTYFPKLLTAALSFLLNVIERMPPTARKNFSASLFDRLWKVREKVKNGAALSLLYRCMGILGKSEPCILVAHVQNIALMFRSIAQVPDDVAYANIDCLTQWLDGVRNLTDPSVTNSVKDLIQEFITHENEKCRLIALKYVESFLTSCEMDLRWMILQACGDSRDEIRNEAIRLIDMSLKVNVSVNTVVSCLWDRLNMGVIDSESRADPSIQFVSSLVHQMCSRYLWAVVARAVGIPVDVETADNGNDFVHIAPKINRFISDLSVVYQERVTKIALYAVKDAHDVSIFHIAACFSAAHLPNFVSPSIISACVQRCRSTSRSEMANVAAHLAISLMSDKERDRCFSSSFSALEKPNVTAGDCWLASESIAFHAFPLPNVLSVINQLLSIAENEYNKPSNLLESAVGALANILRTILLHYEDFALPPEALESLVAVCEKIAISRKNAVSAKAHEESTRAVGFTATALTSELFHKLTSSLYTIGNGPPQPELQLLVGAALYDVALGPHSASRRNVYLSSEDEIQLSFLPSTTQDSCEARLSQIFSNILNKKLSSINHHERRSALIWLYVVVQKSFRAKAKLLHGLLEKIQSAFVFGLAENSDFTQNIASSGISLVYEIASPDQRKILASNLISQISEGTLLAASNVVLNTVPESRITGADSQHMNTYKEFCSLATGLNQPDLVYKFIYLARHNSKWNSGEGAAVGLAAVLEEVHSELAPFFSQLIPKLFRYRYDPDPEVKQSMCRIWSGLTKSRRNLVEEFVDDIASELKQQLTHQEWRVRESACFALADFIQSNDSTYIRSITLTLIVTVFRLRDDIKQSVRLAADRALVNLGKLVLRLLSQSSEGNNPSVFLGNLLPVLIQNGIHSEVNKDFSVSLLLELTKTVKSHLQPFLPELIPSLIDTISDTEPGVFNYIAARSSLAELEMLDDARAQIARTSPLMTAVHDLIPQIDGPVFEALQPRLCEQFRSSVGSSTRSACAQLVILLALRLPQQLLACPAQCDKIFIALMSGIHDRNPSVRKNFASAISYMAKYASSSCFEKLMSTVWNDLVGEDESMKQSAKQVLKSLCANSAELLQRYSNLVVPYVFLETCQPVTRGDETSKKRREEWCELWSEIVPSTEAAIRLHGAEIITFGVNTLKNNDVWFVRVKAAIMLTQAVEHYQGRLKDSDAATLLSALMPMLSGRIWNGKEHLISAISAIISNAGQSIRQHWTETNLEELFVSLKKEASKTKKVYAAAGLVACAVFARSLSYSKAADWLFEKVDNNVRKVLEHRSESDHSEDEIDTCSKDVRVSEFIGQNMTAIAKAAGAYSGGPKALSAIDSFCSYLTSIELSWKAKQTLVLALLDLVDSWQLDSVLDATKLVDALLTMAEQMIEQQRKSLAIQNFGVISKLVHHRDFYAIQWNKIKAKWRNNELLQRSWIV